MKAIGYILLVISFLVIQGCAYQGRGNMGNRFVPPINYEAYAVISTGPSAVTSADNPSYKEGRASAYSILGLIAFGNAGSAAAARNGGIKVIKSSRVEEIVIFKYFIPFYAKYTTIVSGS